MDANLASLKMFLQNDVVAMFRGNGGQPGVQPRFRQDGVPRKDTQPPCTQSVGDLATKMTRGAFVRSEILWGKMIITGTVSLGKLWFISCA